jgi:hypothetical protein
MKVLAGLLVADLARAEEILTAVEFRPGDRDD